MRRSGQKIDPPYCIAGYGPATGRLTVDGHNRSRTRHKSKYCSVQYIIQALQHHKVKQAKAKELEKHISLIGLMDSWTHGLMDLWTHGIMGSWTYGLMDLWTYGLTESWTHGHMY